MRVRIVNVIDEGADPSGRTDATEAFKKALADTTAFGVIVPAGVYRLSGIISGDAPPTPASTGTEATGNKSSSGAD